MVGGCAGAPSAGEDPLAVMVGFEAKVYMHGAHSNHSTMAPSYGRTLLHVTMLIIVLAPCFLPKEQKYQAHGRSPCMHACQHT